MPWVVCWSTACDDEAAREFSVRFFYELSRQGSKVLRYRNAFRAATSYVRSITRHGKLDNGIPSEVPKFVFRDPVCQATKPCRDVDLAPMAASQQQEVANSNEPISAGVGMLLCPRAEGRPATTDD